VGKHADLIAKLAEEQLAQGEQLIVAVLANYNGTVPPASLPASGMVPRAEGEPPPVVDPDALVVFPSARQLAMGLTGGRILVWSLGFSGKPKQFIGDVPLSAITGVSEEDARNGDILRLALASGAKVDVEIVRGESGVAFVGELRNLLELG